MRNNTVENKSFQETLAKEIKAKFPNQHAFAQRIGVTQATVSKYLSGTILPSFQILQKIYKILDIPANLLPEATSHSIPIPYIHSAVSAGRGLAMLDNNPDSIYFDKKWLENIFYLKNANDLFTTRAKGDSMEPLIYEGDIIFAKFYNGNTFTQGLYIVEYNNDYFIKKLQFKSPTLIKLISENNDYDPIEVNLQEENISFRVIAHVVGTISIKNFPHEYNF